MSSSTSTSGETPAWNSDVYAKYRPQYTPEVFEAILSFHRTHGSGKTTLGADIAAGSGQATVKLAEVFDQVIGVDASEQQIKAALSKANITYVVGTAEDCSAIKDSSVDLITVAAGLHWFNQRKFYQEAWRILAPQGTIASFCYLSGAPTLTTEAADLLGPDKAKDVNDKLKAAYHEIYHRTLRPYFDPRIEIVDAAYSGLEPSKLAPELFANEERKTVLMRKRMPISSVCGYVTTWSGHSKFLSSHPAVTRGSSEDPATKLHEQLSTALSGAGLAADADVVMEWPVFMILATKKA